MSEAEDINQVDALNRLAREHGGSTVDGGGPPEVIEEGGEKPSHEVPWIELPREGRVITNFARELGDVCAKNGVYRRDKIAVTINKESGLIDVMQPEEFIGYAEGLCVPFIYKVKKVDEDEFTKLKVAKSMSKQVATTTLRHPDFVYRQRKLERVNPVRMPIMRGDGRIELLQEGYDRESGILTLTSGVKISEDMALDEAVQGLFSIYREFPFSDWDVKRSDKKEGRSRSLSVQIASMLAFYGALLLPLNALRLGALFNANSHGAGKTLLMKMIITTVMGKCRLRALPKNEEEFRKLLDAAALGAAPYIAIDNVSGNLKNDDLDAFITSEDWGGRVMHSQREYEVPRQSIVFITGHNLTLSGDLARRLLESKLSIEEADIRDRVVKREYDDNWLKRPAVRSELLSALWCIIRHWDKAGRPHEGATTMGGFKEWCKIFGGMTVFSGFGDPCERPAADESPDSELEDMRALITALVGELEKGKTTAEFRFSEVLEFAVTESCFSWMIDGRWKDPKDGPKFYEATSKTESMLGRLFSMKYGGRIFTLKDGRKVRFGQHGKNRQKKYTVTIVEGPSA